MKTTNSNIGHAFFYQEANEIQASNIFSTGDVIYSYGYHFPLAAIVRNKNEEKIAYFLTSSDYSVTTAKHKSHVFRSCPNDLPVFSIPLDEIKIFPGYQGNKVEMTKEASIQIQGYYLLKAKNHLHDANNRRNPNYIRHDVNQAYQTIRSFYKFRDLFTGKKRLSKKDLELIRSINSFDFSDLEEKIKKYEERQDFLDQTRHEREEKTRQRRLKESQEIIENWQSGSLPVLPYKVKDLIKYDLVRITEDNRIQTSQNITLTCEESLFFYKALRANLVKEGSKINHYTVQRIDDQEVKIGCHLFKIEHLLNVGSKLNCTG